MPGWEAGKDLGLPREPGEALWVSREGVGEDLQRDLAVELRVGRLPDLAHPAFPEEGGHVVVPEASAGAERHWSVNAVIYVSQRMLYGLSASIDRISQRGYCPSIEKASSTLPGMKFARP